VDRQATFAGVPAAATRRIAPRRLRNRRRLGPLSRASALDSFSVVPIFPISGLPASLRCSGFARRRHHQRHLTTHYFERTFFLGPADDGAEHVYALLAKALEKSGLAAVCSYAPKAETAPDLMEVLRASLEGAGDARRRRASGSKKAPTLEQLRRRAAKAGIEGRSKMSRAELERALEAA
jgi:hypothetical protein